MGLELMKHSDVLCCGKDGKNLEGEKYKWTLKK